MNKNEKKQKEDLKDKPDKEEKIKKVKVAKKKVLKNISTGIAFVNATFNNTIVTIADDSGNVIAWSPPNTTGIAPEFNTIRVRSVIFLNVPSTSAGITSASPTSTILLFSSSYFRNTLSESWSK